MTEVAGRPRSKWTGQTEVFKLMFHNFPSLAEVILEKELCCGRGCLSLGEQEKRGSSFFQLHNQRATDPLHLPKLFLNVNAWGFFFWRKA